MKNLPPPSKQNYDDTKPWLKLGMTLEEYRAHLKWLFNQKYTYTAIGDSYSVRELLKKDSFKWNKDDRAWQSSKEPPKRPEYSHLRFTKTIDLD